MWRSFPRACRAAIDKFLWESSFSLDCGCKAIVKGNALYAAGSLYCSAVCLVQAVYAHNRQYLLNEKGCLARLKKLSAARYPEGYYGYEAGQSYVEDGFSWFVDNCVPAAYHSEAESRGINLHRLLREKAERLHPGQSGLLALDLLNGVRSPRIDFDLTAMLLGLTLQSRPEEMYRALIEGMAFGARQIIEGFLR